MRRAARALPRRCITAVSRKRAVRNGRSAQLVGRIVQDLCRIAARPVAISAAAGFPDPAKDRGGADGDRDTIDQDVGRCKTVFWRRRCQADAADRDRLRRRTAAPRCRRRTGARSALAASAGADWAARCAGIRDQIS